MDARLPVTSDKVLTGAERQRLRRLVQELGEDQVRQGLGLGKLPFARIAAGLPVLRATVVVARSGLRGMERARP